MLDKQIAKKLYCNELLFSDVHIERWQPRAHLKLMAIESHIVTNKLAAEVHSTASAMFTLSPLDSQTVKVEEDVGSHRT